MNRYICNLSLLLLAAAFLLCMPPLGRGAQGQVLRLHILAHSDSARDQQVKRLVRDAVLAFERENFAAAQSREEAAAALMEDAGTLLARIEAVLRENGCDYGARLSLGVYGFPDRVYARTLYPAGDYGALRVVLGAGAGQNWWCVLFPPLCIWEDENGQIEYEEDGSVKWKSLLAEKLHRGEKTDEEELLREPAPAVFDAALGAHVRLPGGRGGGRP